MGVEGKESVPPEDNGAENVIPFPVSEADDRQAQEQPGSDPSDEQRNSGQKSRAERISDHAGLPNDRITRSTDVEGDETASRIFDDVRRRMEQPPGGHLESVDDDEQDQS